MTTIQSPDFTISVIFAVSHNIKHLTTEDTNKQGTYTYIMDSEKSNH